MENYNPDNDPDYWQNFGNTIVKGSFIIGAIFIMIIVILHLLGLLPEYTPIQL
jgi:hypothetical protein